jgi:hypothetical protein
VQPAGEQLQADLAGIGKTMVEEWSAAAGPEGQALVDEYYKAQ